MTKRFKKGGARVELTFGEWLETPADDNVSSALLRCGNRQWRLTAEDIRRIQAADLLEDVPEPKTPGQRLFEECAIGPRRWDWCHEREEWEAKAARLGIKPEGE